MSDGKGTLARRRFLGMVGAAAATAMVAPGCGNGSTSQNTAPFDAGAATDYVAPMWRLFQSNTTIVARDALGFFAFTAVCPHAGCLVTFDTPGGATGGADEASLDGNSNCPCHSSRFLPDGSLVSGPARTGLEHFTVQVTNGRVIVSPATVVASSTRTTG